MRFVASKSPVAGEHKTLGKFSIDVEVPQVESVEEFTTFAGGADKALLFINRAISTAATNGGRAKARGYDPEKDKEVTAESLAKGGKHYLEVQEIVKSYTPQNSRETGGLSAAKSKVVASSLATAMADPNKKSFSREEIEALLAAAK